MCVIILVYYYKNTHNYYVLNFYKHKKQFKDNSLLHIIVCRQNIRNTQVNRKPMNFPW